MNICGKFHASGKIDVFIMYTDNYEKSEHLVGTIVLIGLLKLLN